MKATILKRLLVVLIVLSFGFVLVLLNTHHNIDFDNDEAKTISYRPPATASTFLSQAGTEADPYVIANASDMITLAK